MSDERAPEEGLEPEAEDEVRIVPPPSNPMAIARQFVAEHFAGDDVDLLRRHRGDFYIWNGSCWPETEEEGLRANLYRWLEPACYIKQTEAGPKSVPFEPNRNKVANAIEALKAVTHLSANVFAPAWLDRSGVGQEDRPIDARAVVAVANGLLHLPTRTLYEHTPTFFSQYALPFDFDPNAPAPERWLRFMDELWGDDVESIETLAEVMGYVLGGGTSQQKIVMLIGPKRSGKGTIARVLIGLLGAHNHAAPTLSSLTINFGLQPLIGKPLAVISDARLGTRADNLTAVERLLSISGEDTITVDRKNRDPWTGRLPTRFVILTNELPRFTDSSGALASRFILLVLTESFFGRENPRLTDELLEEAPGIFNWALEGLDRLNARGYFIQPESAREAMSHLEDLASPVGAFVRECCEVGVGFEMDKDELFAAWRTWCENEGILRPGTKALFVRNLRAAVPGLRPSRPREGEIRRHTLRGIELRPQWVGPGSIPDQSGPAQDGSGSGPGSGQGSDFGKPLQIGRGQGWAGVESTFGPTSARDEPDELLGTEPV
jgi:putative DNA primase/helicase